MAISIGASAQTALSAFAASVVVTAPTGIVDGDILVGAYYHAGSTSAGVTLPAGFTQWAVNGTSLDGFRFVHLCWKRAASESGDYTFARSGTAKTSAACITVIKGCKASGDPANVAPSNTLYQTSNTTIRAAAITPTVESCLVWVGLVYSNPQTLTEPTGFTMQADPNDNTLDYKLVLATKLGQAAGATGDIDGTVVTTTIKHAMMVALEPYVLVAPTLTAAQVGSDIQVGWS